MYYTPGQVSEMLKIPASTIRFYARKFTEYLSPQGGRKQRLYTERDLLTFSQIKDLSAQNIPLDQIGDRLRFEEPEPPNTQPTALALIPSVAAELEYANVKTREALSRLESLETKNRELASQVNSLKTWAALPWWKRFFSHPPF